MRLTKYEIAAAIERQPGNTPWGLRSMMTIMVDHYTRQELVEKYNERAVALNMPTIN